MMCGGRPGSLLACPASVVAELIMVDYRRFKMSLSLLEEQHGHCQEADESLPGFIREALRESVVKRFELCYDCLHETLRRHLVEEFGIPDIPNSPKSIFRRAFGNGLFDMAVEPWLSYAEYRAGTMHQYDGKKSLACLEVMPEFIGDAACLYETMTGEPWE